VTCYETCGNPSSDPVASTSGRKKSPRLNEVCHYYFSLYKDCTLHTTIYFDGFRNL